jgi:hypothetical protein
MMITMDMLALLITFFAMLLVMAPARVPPFKGQDQLVLDVGESASNQPDKLIALPRYSLAYIAGVIENHLGTWAGRGSSMVIVRRADAIDILLGNAEPPVASTVPVASDRLDRLHQLAAIVSQWPYRIEIVVAAPGIPALLSEADRRARRWARFFEARGYAGMISARATQGVEAASEIQTILRVLPQHRLPRSVP